MNTDTWYSPRLSGVSATQAITFDVDWTHPSWIPWFGSLQQEKNMITVNFECPVKCGVETGTLYIRKQFTEPEYKTLVESYRFTYCGIAFCFDGVPGLDLDKGINITLKGVCLKYSEAMELEDSDYAWIELNESEIDA